MKPQPSSTIACNEQGCHRSTPRFFKRLLVAVDGSEQSGFATDLAAQLARQLHADVVLVNVYCSAFMPYSEVSFVEPNIRETCIEISGDLLKKARAKMPNPEQVQMVLRDGNPATEILKAAMVYDIDLIVMGTHARGHLAQAVLGSVAKAVMQKSTCPVLTVAHGPSKLKVDGNPERFHPQFE